MKILYVSQYFPPEMGAPAARAAELARHWTKAGHEVIVLTGFPNHPTGIIHPIYRRQFRRLFMRERFDGIRVARTWLLPLPNGKAFQRMLNYTSFCLSSAAAGLFLAPPDVVIASSPQLLVGLSGYWLARWMRAPFIFEVRDLWPESLAAVGMASPESGLHRSLSKVSEFLYRRSDHVVVVTPAFKDFLIQNWNVASEKISVVENGVETKLFSPHAANPELKRQLGAADKFLVSYIGTMGMAHALETVLQAAQNLQHTAPQVCFMLVGEGSEKARLRAEACNRGLKNILFLDQQPRETIPALIGASDACLVLLKKTELFKTVIPTKMLEFMSCGRPVILGVDGQARSIVEQSHSGIAIEPENVTALSSAIMRLAADPTLCSMLGVNGRRCIMEQFSRRRTAAEYVRVLEAVLDGIALREATAA